METRCEHLWLDCLQTWIIMLPISGEGLLQKNTCTNNKYVTLVSLLFRLNKLLFIGYYPNAKFLIASALQSC